MTQREFYTNVSNGTIGEAEIEFATNAIAKMDAANEARKNKPSKKAIENAPLVEQIVNEILGTEAVTASTVAEALGVSVQKASNLLRQAVAAGKAVSTDVKVAGKGSVKGYTLAE